jgi:hypothetical protein
MPQQITVSLRMYAPTAYIFGLRAVTNRAKKARSRGLPACDSRVRRRSDQSLTLCYDFLDFASYTLTYDNAGHPGPVILARAPFPACCKAPAFLEESWSRPSTRTPRCAYGRGTNSGFTAKGFRRR